VLGAWFVAGFGRPRGAVQVWGVVAVVVAVSLGAPRGASAQLGALVSPGRLSRAHASLEGITRCLQCHTAGRGVVAEKCLTCHTPVAERIARKTGVHRAVTTDCVACHVEHAGVDAELRPFDIQRFNHTTETGFPLDGLHAPLAGRCESCHKTRSFLTASPSCASCHTDAHKGSLGASCATCHTTAVRFAESRARFDHSRTSFPLSGAHASATCSACHTNKTYKVASASCASCHTDPHRATLGASCASCHTSQSWRTTRVDHSRTAFPLRGQHASVQCASCHTKPAMQVRPKADTCASCHTDPHRGAFKQDCASCHTESTFRKAVSSGFDHSTTRFPLVDKHAGLACAACHAPQSAPATGARTPPPAARRGGAAAPAAAARGTGARGTPSRAAQSTADFKGLQTECVSCHADVHRAELGTSCETCHTARTFEVSTFRHARQRPFFDGQHAALRCAQCHPSSYPATPMPTAARSSGVTAARRAAAPSTALRVGFTATSDTCASCHRDVHLGQVGARCETCHTVDIPTFAVRQFQHSATKFSLTGKHVPLTCEACHTVATQAFPSGHGTALRLTGIGSECASCHQDAHQGDLGRDCQRCHSTDTFTVKRYTHLNARTLRGFFTGRHITACAACHKAAASRTGVAASRIASYRVSTACVSCHTDVHRGALGPRCETCHKP
jgi:hypothetical protein